MRIGADKRGGGQNRPFFADILCARPPCGLYRSIKLLEHAMKVLERVFEGIVRKIVKISNM